MKRVIAICCVLMCFGGDNGSREKLGGAVLFLRL